MLYLSALFATLLCVPFFRYLDSLADEGVCLHAAARILDGKVLYRDFFEFLPPGSFLMVAGWMKVVGAGFASVRVLAIGVIAVTAGLLYVAARLSSGSRFTAATVAFIWISSLQGGANVISHHWFTTMVSMASGVCVFLALERPHRWGYPVAAGLFAGTAAMVTSTRGALLCLVVLGLPFTLPPGRVRLLSTAVGIAIFPLAMTLYLVSQGAMGMAVQDVILTTARQYPVIQSVSFASFARASDAVVVTLFPATFALAGAVVILTRGAILREARFRASFGLALVGFFGLYPRPDIAHIIFAAPLAGPLLAMVVAGLLDRARGRTRFAVVAAVVLLCLVTRAKEVRGQLRSVAMAAALDMVPSARGPIVVSPRPWKATFAGLMAEIAKTPAASPFFFYPYDPMLPYLTERHHVAEYDVLVPGYTTPEQFREACRRVLLGAEWVVIDHEWRSEGALRYLFPSMANLNPPEKVHFELAIATAFNEVVFRWGVFELRHKVANPPQSFCSF